MRWKSVCPQFDQQLKLHVTGCPNSCGQHWIADIGLEGKKIKHEGELDGRLLLLPRRRSRPARRRRPARRLSLPRHRWFPTPSSACCATISRHASRRKICAPGSAATPTRNCAPSSPEKSWPPSNAICPPAAYRTDVRPIEECKAMSMLPIFLKLEGRRCLLVGAGNVALEKIGSLLKTGLRLRVVAPQARPEIRQLAVEGKLEWIERPFEPADLDGNYLVIAATDAPASQRPVYREAVRAQHPCQQRRRHSQLRFLLRLRRQPRQPADRHLHRRRKPRPGPAPPPRNRRAAPRRSRPLA